MRLAVILDTEDRSVHDERKSLGWSINAALTGPSVDSHCLGMRVAQNCTESAHEPKHEADPHLNSFRYSRLLGHVDQCASEGLRTSSNSRRNSSSGIAPFHPFTKVQTIWILPSS